MRIITKVNPLITNFMIAKKPEVLQSNDVAFLYDYELQITYFLGGGSSRPTRSFDGYKATKRHTHGSNYLEENDAERWTDD